MYAMLDRAAERLARWLAVAGGLVLLALVALTCASIFGRSMTAIGLDQITGDFEMLEMGMAFAIFAFMPWALYARGHARVDLLAPVYPGAMNRGIDLVSDILFLVAAWVIASRLWLGLSDKMAYNETTFILQVPLWYAYAAAMVGAAGFVLVAAFCVIRSACALIRGDGPGPRPGQTVTETEEGAL